MTATVDSTATVQVVALEQPTAKDLQRLARRLETLITQRDQLVMKAIDEGASLREIGNLLGVSHVTVRNIILKITEGDATEAHHERTGIGDDDTRF